MSQTNVIVYSDTLVAGGNRIMMGPPPKTPRIGDVIEFPVSGGLGYAQYGHWHKDWGDLARVLPVVATSRAPDPAGLASLPERFWAFTSLKGAVRKGKFSVVASADLPEHARGFPLFRVAGVPDSSGRLQWWLWDGNRSWRVGKLLPEQVGLPLRELWTTAFFQERIAGGWVPGLEAGNIRPTRPIVDPWGTVLAHRLLVDDLEGAGRLVGALAAEGFVSEMDPGANPLNLTAWKPEPAVDQEGPRLQATREALERVANAEEVAFTGPLHLVRQIARW